MARAESLIAKSGFFGGVELRPRVFGAAGFGEERGVGQAKEEMARGFLRRGL
jgi:hypothetical protein